MSEEAPNILQVICDEIWLNIFSFLMYEDLLSIQLVCHKFYSLSKEGSLWKEYLIKYKKISENNLEKVQSIHSSEFYDITKEFYSYPKQLIGKVKVHRDEVLHGCWSRDGKLFATASRDKHCLVYELEELLKLKDSKTGEPPKIKFFFNSQHFDLGRVGFSPDNQFLFASTVSPLTELPQFRGRIYILSLATHSVVGTVDNSSFDNFPWWIASSKFVYTNSFYYDELRNGYVQQFSIIDIHAPPTHDFPKFSIFNEEHRNYFHLSTFSPNGKTLASIN